MLKDCKEAHQQAFQKLNQNNLKEFVEAVNKVRLIKNIWLRKFLTPVNFFNGKELGITEIFLLTSKILSYSVFKSEDDIRISTIV